MRQCACALLVLFFWSGLPTLGETVTGKIVINSKPRKVSRSHKKRALRSTRDKRDYPDQTKRKAASRDEVSAVVVSVINPPNKGKNRAGVMRQKDKAFLPYVLPVVVGTDVQFPNDDKIYHGVYSESEAQPFELPQYANGESRTVTFKKPGVVELFCHIHAHMNAYIVVLENSYFAQPDKNHLYTIDGLKPGKYKIKAWHPRLGSQVRSIEVKPGQKTVADFTL